MLEPPLDVLVFVTSAIGASAYPFKRLRQVEARRGLCQCAYCGLFKTAQKRRALVHPTGGARMEARWIGGDMAITSRLRSEEPSSLGEALFRSAARLCLALLLAAPFSCLAVGAEARSLALVIGNDAYANVTKLRTAVGDSRAIGDQLEKMGFIVRRAQNADQRAMSRALAGFYAEIQPGDRALFFYSGHGFEISGANYLLPTDVPAARPNQVELVRDAAIPVERIIDGVRERGAQVTILVLDACRDNPFAPPGTRGAPATRGLARIDAPEGVFILMSAGAKQEALDRLTDGPDEVNSVFTRTFLRELAKPGRTLVQIAKATQIGVKQLAATIGYEQTPAYYDEVVGDVVLYDGPADATASAAAKDGAAPAPALIASSGTPANRPAIASPASAPIATPSAGAQMAALTPDKNLPDALKIGAGAPIANFMRSNAGWTV